MLWNTQTWRSENLYWKSWTQSGNLVSDSGVHHALDSVTVNWDNW